MIPIKTDQEIEKMREGGKRLTQVLNQVLRAIKPGVSLEKLDKLAESLIEKKGGKPSFKMVKGYHWATCINVNQGVVHGVPDGYRLKEGDLVSVDMGMFYKGLHTDMARTLCVRRQKAKVKIQKDKFLETGKEALKKAIKAAKPGNRIGHISKAIQDVIQRKGYKPIEALTGHGVGKELHEEPQIPCFLKGKIEETPMLEPGMTLAIEAIYAQGSPEIVVAPNGWTIETQDGKMSGLFEETVAVTRDGPLILTR